MEFFVNAPLCLGSLPHVHIDSGPEQGAFVDLLPLYPSVPEREENRNNIA